MNLLRIKSKFNGEVIINKDLITILVPRTSLGKDSVIINFVGEDVVEVEGTLDEVYDKLMGVN